MAQESIDKLLEWFKANNGFVHEGIELKHDSKYGFHFVASSKLAGNTTVCVCPANLAFSHVNAKSNISSILTGRVDPEDIVFFCLVEQKLKGSDSFWAPYIDLLPKESELTTPLYFERPDIDWLRGTNLYSSAVPEGRTAVELRRHMYKNSWKEGISILRGRGVDVSQYTW
jgi:hypothetical protein